MAWLHAVPRPPEGSRRAEIAAKGDQEPKLSRLDRLKKDGVQPELPPNPLPHVVNRLIEISLAEAAGMGIGPVSWLMIHAWQQVTGIELGPWEGRIIRRLSLAYVAEGRKAESENCPPPFHTQVTEREKVTELATLQMVLG